MPTFYNRVRGYIRAWRAVQKDLAERVSFQNPSEENMLFLSKRAPRSYEEALFMFDMAKHQAANLWVRILEINERPHTPETLRLLDEKLDLYLWFFTAEMHYIGRAEAFRDESTSEDEVQARRKFIKPMFVRHMNLKWHINHERMGDT
jgi:hypothetical protein